MIGQVKPSFEPAAIDYSLVNAHFLALASSSAYSANAAVPGSVKTATENAELEFDTVAEFGDANAAIAGFVGTRADATVVSFRGTFNVPGWMADANVVQDALGGKYPGKVHRGFARGVEEVWAQACALVPSAGAGTPRVWVTGHSLGAALATLAASRFISECGLDVAACYTYGCPRVGDLDFYTEYKPSHYRHVNDQDVVPHVPLEEMVVVDTEAKVDLLHPWKFVDRFRYLRYKHTGTLKYFNRQGILGEGENNWADKKALVLESLSHWGKPKVEAVDDHAIADYIKSIETNM